MTGVGESSGEAAAAGAGLGDGEAIGAGVGDACSCASKAPTEIKKAKNNRSVNHMRR